MLLLGEKGGGRRPLDSEVRVDLFDTHSSSWLTVLANPAQEIWGDLNFKSAGSEMTMKNHRHFLFV